MTAAAVVLGLLIAQLAPAYAFYHHVSDNQVCDPKGLWLDRIRSGQPDLARCLNLCDADASCSYAVFHGTGRSNGKPWCYTYELCGQTRASVRATSLHVKDGAAVFTSNGVITAESRKAKKAKKDSKKVKYGTDYGMGGKYKGKAGSMGKSGKSGKGKSMGKSMGKSNGTSMGKSGGMGMGGGVPPSGGTSGEPDLDACDACASGDALTMLRFEVMAGANAGTTLASTRGTIECSADVSESCWMEEVTVGAGCPSVVLDLGASSQAPGPGRNMLGITPEWAAFTDTSCAPFATTLHCFDASDSTPLTTKRLTYRDHNGHATFAGFEAFESEATNGIELTHALANSLFIVHNGGVALPATIQCAIEGPRELCFGPPGFRPTPINYENNLLLEVGEPGLSTCADPPPANSPSDFVDCVRDFAYAEVFGDTNPAVAAALNAVGGNLCKNNVSGFRGYEFFSTEPFAADNLAVEGSYDPYFKQTVTLDTSCGGTTPPLTVGDQFGFMRVDGFLTSGGVDDVQCGTCAGSDPSLNRVCVGPDFALFDYNAGQTICNSEAFAEIATQTECPAPPQDCLICGDRSSGSKDSLTSIVFLWTEYNNQAINIEVPGQVVTVVGDTVTVTSASGGKFGANTEFIINGESAVLHTSCSQPIYVGLNLRFLTGVLTLVEFGTVNGRSASGSCSEQPPYVPPATDAEACSCRGEGIPDCLMNGFPGPVLNYAGSVDGVPPRCCPHFWVGCAIAWNVGFLLVEGGESSARQNADMGYMEVLTGMANIGVKSSLAECNEDDIGNGASRNGLVTTCWEDYALLKYGTDVKYGIVLGQLLNRVLNVEQDEDDSTSPGIRVGIVAGGVVGTLLIVTVLVLVVSKYRAQRGGTGRLDNNVALSTSSQPARRLQAARLLLAASRAEDAAESKAPEVVDQVAESTPVYNNGTLVVSPEIWVAGGADHAETKSEVVTHQMISRADSDHSTSSSTVRRTALI